ncbi:MAG: hypothetical protein KC589_08150 [Nanoarchaeota archaeon]|nr:hypothetical protein [Nanoarchaeota archaeon]
MLFTLTMPHVINGRKVQNRTSDKYLTLKAILENEKYEHPKHIVIPGIPKGTNIIRRDEKNYRNQFAFTAFEPSRNKNNYLVKASDENTSISTLELKNQLFEAAMIKIWLPNEKILENMFWTLNDTLFFQHLAFDTGNLGKKNNGLHNRIQELISNYNQSFKNELRKKTKHEEEDEKTNKYFTLSEALGYS